MLSPVKLWRNQKYTREFLGKTGRIIAWTNIHVPPDGFSDQAPYPVVIVQLDAKTRITAQLVDYEGAHLHTGQKVRVVVRRITSPDPDGIIPYGVKVKPLI